MPSLYKMFLLFFILIISGEGKAAKDVVRVPGSLIPNEGVLPVEVFINHPSNAKVLPTENSLMRNKAIKLKIRSNRNKDSGNVDLIIAATKEVQATEQNIDRYSPAFNAENSFMNKENPGDLKSSQKMNQNWDTSRQDSSLFYPSQSEEIFPYMTMRSVLQNSQPSLLGQNHFSPLQSLRYFENNLQNELLTHINPGLGSLQDIPMGLVVSQPVFTNGISPGTLNQQGLQNTPQLLNAMQQRLFHPMQRNNQNLPLTITQQGPGFQNPASNRYSLINGTPQNQPPLHNQNFPQNSPNSPQFLQQYSGLQRNQPPLPELSHPPQSIPDILDRNKQPIPLQQRPEYTLDRNHQAINNPIHRNPYQQQSALRELPGPHLNMQQQLNNGIHNYQPNRDLPERPYYQSERDNRHSYHSPQQPITPQHHPTMNSAQGIPNNQRNLYNHQNVQNLDNNRINLYQERFRPPPRELHTEGYPVNQINQQHPPHVLSQQQQRNNFENAEFRNGPPAKLPEDDEKLPVYHRPPPEGSRPLYQQNIPPANYPHRNSPSTELNQPQNNLPPSQRSHRQFYHEPSYRSQSRDSGIKDSDFGGHADEVHEAVRKRQRKQKIDEDYDSSAPPKKRKLKSRKRPSPKDKIDDLVGHASHQYIIKIG